MLALQLLAWRRPHPLLAALIVVAPAFGQEPSTLEPDASAAVQVTEAGAPRLRLVAPLAGPRDAFFYSGLLLPPLDAATTPPPWTLDVRLRTSLVHSAFTRDSGGSRSRFDGLFIGHARLDLGLMVTERIELQATLRVAGWEERRDVFEVRVGRTLVVEGEAKKEADGTATGRHENLAQVQLGALVRWWESDDGQTAFATAVGVKLPGFRRADLTNSNTLDVAVTGLFTLGLAPGLALHVNGGVVAPFGQQWLFEVEAFEVDVLLQGAAGVTWAVTDWLALGASLEGATSPWEDVPVLDRPAVSAVGGVRLLLGRFTVEVGGGAGLGSGGAEWIGWVELGWVSRPLADP